MINQNKFNEDKNLRFDEKFQREYQYTGVIGYLNRMQHRHLTPQEMMHKNVVLEIGPSFEPHCKHVSLNFQEYHCIDTNSSSDLKKYFKDNFKKVNFVVYDGKNIPFENEKFDRIVISHCLEHVNDPEKFINEMFRVLKNDGILSVALPCDNGFLWRMGRYALKKTFLRKKGFDELDYNYQMAIEHKNTIFQLIAIFKRKLIIKKEIFLPFRIKFPDLNLYYVCQIAKK